MLLRYGVSSVAFVDRTLIVVVRYAGLRDPRTCHGYATRVGLVNKAIAFRPAEGVLLGTKPWKKNDEIQRECLNAVAAQDLLDNLTCFRNDGQSSAAWRRHLTQEACSYANHVQQAHMPALISAFWCSRTQRSHCRRTPSPSS